MIVYVVHYSYSENNDSHWRFVGVFSDETQAREWCEKRFVTMEWRNAHAGEPKGLHIEGQGKSEYDPDWFNVMPVEIDDLLKKESS